MGPRGCVADLENKEKSFVKATRLRYLWPLTDRNVYSCNLSHTYCTHRLLLSNSADCGQCVALSPLVPPVPLGDEVNLQVTTTIARKV